MTKDIPHRIVRKEIHGQWVDVKVYPYIPEDEEENISSTLLTPEEIALLLGDDSE